MLFSNTARLSDKEIAKRYTLISLYYLYSDYDASSSRIVEQPQRAVLADLIV